MQADQLKNKLEKLFTFYAEHCLPLPDGTVMECIHKVEHFIDIELELIEDFFHLPHISIKANGQHGIFCLETGNLIEGLVHPDFERRVNYFRENNHHLLKMYWRASIN